MTYCRFTSGTHSKVYVSNVRDAIYGTGSIKNLWEPATVFPKIPR